MRIFPLFYALLLAARVFAATPEVIAQGQYMFQASGCMNCHTVDAQKPLAGGVELHTNFGRFYGPNISRDKVHGIGSWTDAQFIRAVKQGLSPSGKYYYPAFPFAAYTKLTDADVLAMRAYMNTLPASSERSRSHQISFPLNQRPLLFFWRKSNFKPNPGPRDASVFKYRGTFRPVAGKSDSWNRGAYLVEGALHCTECHTPRTKLGGLKSGLWMAGAFFEGAVADNLTSDRGTGKGNWTSEDWNKFLKTGQLPEVGEVGGEMRDVIMHGTSKLTEDDRQAVIEYLQALKPIDRSLRAIQANSEN